MVTSTQHFISNEGRAGRRICVANNHLVTFRDHLAIDRTGIVRGALTAPTECFDLQRLDTIGKFDKPGRAREKSCPEISQDPKSVNVDSQSVRDSRQTFYLRFGVELGLIADDVVDTFADGQLVNNKFMDVETRGDLDSFRAQS